MSAGRPSDCWQLRAGFALLAWALLTPTLTRADEPLLFRRERTPTSLVDKQARGMWPVERSEFESLLRDLRSRSVTTHGPRTGFARAEYQVHFNGTRLVDGKGRLVVAPSGKSPDVPPESTAPRTISFDDCSLSIREALWDLDPPVKPLFGSDALDRWQLLVDHDANLLLEWSAPPRSIQGEPVFDLRFPKALRHTLVVTAPEGWNLAASDGVVEALPPGDPATGPPRSWRIELPGHAQTTLTFRKAEAALDAEHNAFFNEETSYLVSPGTTEIASRWTLDALGGPLATAQFRVPRDVRIVAVYKDRNPLPFSLTPGTTDDERIVHVKPREPWAGKEQSFSIEAMVPTQLGKNQRLPRLIPVTGQWQSGLRAIRFDDALAVHRFAPGDGLHTAITSNAPSPEGSSTGTRLVQCFSPETDITYWAELKRSAARIEMATLVRLNAESWTAVSTLSLPASSSGDDESVFPLRRPWSIETVRSDPPEAIEDWESIDSNSETTTVRVRWKQGFAGRARTLTIQSRRSDASVEQIERNTVSPLVLPNRAASHHIAIASDAAFGAVRWVSGENVRRLEPATWPESIRKLIETTSTVASSMVVIAEQPPSDFRFSRSPPTSRFVVDVSTEAKIDDGQWWQSTDLRVVPEGTAIERLLVQVAPSTRGELTWSLAESEGIVAAKVINADPTSDTESWELTLPNPIATPFILRSLWTQRLDSPLATPHSPLTLHPPLFACPQAANQTGLVSIVEPLNHHRITVDPTANIVPELRLPAADSAGARRRGFRYDPVSIPKWTATIRTSPPSDPVIHRAELHVWSTGNAFARHVLVCEAEPHGESSLRIELPETAQCDGVYLEGNKVALDHGMERGQVEIPLPQTQGRVTAAIVYRSFDQVGSTIVPRRDLWPKVVGVVADRSLEIHWPTSRTAQPWSARPWEGAWTLDRIGQSILGPLWRNPIAGESESNVPLVADAAWPEWIAPLLSIEHLAPAASVRTNLDSPWRRRQFVGGEAVSPRVYIVDRGVLFAALTALFLAAATAVGWLTRSWTSGTAIILIAVATLGLLVDRGWPGFGCAVVWGGCLGCVWGWFAGTTGSWADRGRIGLPVAAIAMVAACVAAGFSDRVVEAKDSEEIFVVIDPIDDEGKPHDDYVYLPDRFYKLLTQRSSQPKSTARDWLLVGAKYTLRLDNAELREMVSLFEFETTRDRAEVRLPLSRKEWLLAPDAIRVNGQRAVPSWNEQGTHLALTTGEKGLVRVEILSKPNVTLRGDMAGIALSIPSCPISEVHLSASQRDLPRIRRDGYPVEFFADRNGPLAVFRFPRSRKLDIQWPTSLRTGNKEFEQLALLDVRHGSCRLQTQWRVKALDIPFKELRVRYDGNLAWLPKTQSENDDPTIEVDRENRTLVWRFSRPTSEAVIAASWLMRNSRGSGTIVVPAFALDQGQATVNWLGLRAAPNIELRPQRENTPIESDAFALAWKVDRPSFDSAYDLGTTSTSIGLIAARKFPLPYQSNATQLELNRLATRIRWDAELSNIGPGVFQYELAIPEGFEFQSARVLDGGVERPSRFQLVEPGRATIQLNAPAGGSQRLRVDGWLPPAQKSRLPRISVVGAGVVQDRIEVVRAANVTAKITAATGYREVDRNNADQALDDLGRRHLAAFEYELDGPPWDQRGIEAIVEPNRGGFEAAGRIHVSPEGPRWNASLELDLKPAGDPLEGVELETSTTWVGPFVTEPPSRIVREIAGDERRQRLKIIFERPLKEAGTFRISGPVVPPTGESFAIPTVSVPQASPAVLDVFLPRENRGQRMAWDLKGLQPASDGDPMAELRCRVVTPDFTARIQSSIEREPKLEIPFAAATIEHLDGEHVLVTTVLFLRPDERREVTLDLPEQATRVATHLNGFPLSVERPQGSFAVQLDSPELAQTLVVRCRVPASIISRDIVARDIVARDMAARVRDTTPERFFVRVPKASRSAGVSENDVASAWLGAVDQAIESASQRAANRGGGDEIASWAGLIDPQIVAVNALRKHAVAIRGTSADSKSVDDVLTQIKQTEMRLREMVPYPRAARVVETPVWPLLAGRGDGAWLALGADNSLDATEKSTSLSPVVLFWGIWFVGAVAFWMVTRSAMCRTLWQRWPLGLALLAGLGLTFVVQPAVIGWTIAGLAAATGLRSILFAPAWPVPRDTDFGSTASYPVR